MTPPPRRRSSEDACPPPCFNGRTGHAQQAGGDRHRHARQLMPPVFQQNLRGLPDPLLIKPARGHVVQDGNISDHLLSALILARDRHLAPPQVLNNSSVNLFSSGGGSCPVRQVAELWLARTVWLPGFVLAVCRIRCPVSPGGAVCRSPSVCLPRRRARSGVISWCSGGT